MKEIDWSSLGFELTETDYIVRCGFHNGSWEKPYATDNKFLQLHVSATCLQYGQEAFEGLKAFRGIDGKIRIFRMEENAKRLQSSCEALYMAQLPTELFCEAILLALDKNIDYLPPYETGATLYFRPLLIGTTARLGVGPGRDFEFIVIASPIGPYFKKIAQNCDSGLCTTPFIINRHVDRSAPYGTGAYKVGGNYATSFRGTEPAHIAGMGCLFLDSKQHKYIDECGAANFVGIKPLKDKQSANITDFEYITPRSTSILPSITNNSLITVAKDLGINVTRRRIPVEELAEFSECGACGTACVIAPISKIVDPDKNITYNFGTNPGPVCSALYNRLQDIQYGRIADSHHWNYVL